MDDHVCTICSRSFSSRFSRNRHVRLIHPEKHVTSKQSRICCVLCKRKETYPSNVKLIEHLTHQHGIDIEEEVIEFKCVENFQRWMEEERKAVRYARQTLIIQPNYKQYFYICNRNSVGKTNSSTATKRLTRAVGSKKIEGTCPSRIVVKFFNNGAVHVNYVKTHVGHAEELRYERLTKTEKDEIKEKLKAGVPNKRILDDARKLGASSRLQVLTPGDINNVKRVISLKRHKNDMTAVAIKVSTEWNADNKNYGFFFKQIGEEHEFLDVNDFAIAFMNEVMETKLKENEEIICIDGTHNTNRRGWELTTILVKDDRGVGFPVAFLISNRRDQLIYEILLGALRNKVGVLNSKYIMTDDDPKYYNAWKKIMNNEPQHLLCTWHIVKSWNIQGKSKIKSLEIKKNMKKDMGQILRETNEEKFKIIYDNYFKKLEESNEIIFLNYLKKHYFQDEERISSWAYCKRIRAGINTNMAIESLHKFIKYDELNRKRNNSIEDLLDILERVVQDKLWTRVTELERPSMRSYQQRTVRESHQKAVKCFKSVEQFGFGQFKIKSYPSNRIYIVMYGERVCGVDCRHMYCTICQICVHRYICQCPQYTVRNTTCKHTHMVALYERNRNECVEQYEEVVSTIDHNYSLRPLLQEANHIIENEHNYSQDSKNKEINYLLNETQKDTTQDEIRNVRIQRLSYDLKTMEINQCMKLLDKFEELIKQTKQEDIPSKKRKIEKQTYYPTKK